MICLDVAEDMDVCITIDAKVIFKKSASGDLKEEALRQDTKLRAQHIARQFEREIAQRLREQLAEELK